MTERPAEPILPSEIVAVILMMVIGATLRVLFMVRAPGFFYDEAIYALDGLSILRQPGWPIFFDTLDHMREPLFIYMLAGAQHLFGPSVEVARGTATVVGVLTIPVVWLLAREWRGRLFALLAAVLFTFLRWHIHFSGLCFRTITSPLLAAGVMLFFLRLLRTHSRFDAVATGLCLGLGLYSYLSFRLFPFILIPPMLMACWWLGRGLDRPLAVRMATIIGVAALVFAPLAFHFAKNPDHFSGRSDEVRIFDKPELIAKQARDVALMALLRGDHVGKHNIPGPPRFAQLMEPTGEETAALWQLERDAAQSTRGTAMDPHGTGVPVLFPVSGLFFYLGLICVLLRSWREPRELTMVSWLAIGSLASILSFGAPNMLRLLYLSPLAVLLLAEGLRVVAAGLSRLAGSALEGSDDAQGPHRLLRVLLVCGVLGPVVVLHSGVELKRAWDWAEHPMVAPEFNVDLADLGRYLGRQEDRLPVRLPPVLATHPTFVYTADGYSINAPDDILGDLWWDFEANVGLEVRPPVPGAVPVAGGRSHEVRLANGTLIGTLRELERR